jgi:hypothetical protein
LTGRFILLYGTGISDEHVIITLENAEKWVENCVVARVCFTEIQLWA